MRSLCRAWRREEALKGLHRSALILQRAPFAKRASARPAPETEGPKDSRIQKLLQLLAPAEEVELELTPEDAAEYKRRSKEYSRRCMQAHREWQKDLTTRLRLKNEAIAALPADLQEAAMAPPTELFPLDRMIFTDTPPKPEEEKEEVRDDSEKGGVRFGTKHLVR